MSQERLGEALPNQEPLRHFALALVTNRLFRVATSKMACPPHGSPDFSSKNPANGDPEREIHDFLPAERWL